MYSCHILYYKNVKQHGSIGYIESFLGLNVKIMHFALFVLRIKVRVKEYDCVPYNYETGKSHVQYG